MLFGLTVGILAAAGIGLQQLFGIDRETLLLVMLVVVLAAAVIGVVLFTVFAKRRASPKR
ncbi:MAG: hypothetical protein JWO38_2888 [Gemmataceae bacterium]|nr:hypothetical protein [Gemmataceae bacterium]